MQQEIAIRMNDLVAQSIGHRESSAIDHGSASASEAKCRADWPYEFDHAKAAGCLDKSSGNFGPKKGFTETLDKLDNFAGINAAHRESNFSTRERQKT
jgi:hypothetical protein